MGIGVLVLGDSGSGKSTSLRNFEPEELGIFNVAGKPLPFKKHLPSADHATYQQITSTLAKNDLRCYVIDDSSYLLAFDNFHRAKETGYTKFTDMAVSFEKLLEAATHTDANTIVYFLHHYDRDNDGNRKPKTIGRMLDEKLCVEGLFPIVLECTVRDGKHVFVSNNDGTNCAKAPMEMLPDVMDNDLRAVDTLIRDYWGLVPLTPKKPVRSRESAPAKVEEGAAK